MIEGLLAAILAELIYIAITFGNKLSRIEDDLDEIVSVLNGEGIEIIDDPD